MATSMAAAVLSCVSRHKSPSCRKPSNYPHNLHEFNRRAAITTALSTAFVAVDALLKRNTACAFDMRLTVPDQTVEEAEAVVKEHVQELLQIKPLIDSESWKDAQLALRESSGNLKQDLYTIIQGKPRSQRPSLRKLYSTLFNNVSRLDYAARSKDTDLVMEYYNNIVATLCEIFEKI